MLLLTCLEVHSQHGSLPWSPEELPRIVLQQTPPRAPEQSACVPKTTIQTQTNKQMHSLQNLGLYPLVCYPSALVNCPSRWSLYLSLVPCLGLALYAKHNKKHFHPPKASAPHDQCHWVQSTSRVRQICQAASAARRRPSSKKIDPNNTYTGSFFKLTPPIFRTKKKIDF